MKHLLLTTIAAVVLVGCGESQSPSISLPNAAKWGNIEAVKQHIAAGTDVSARGKRTNVVSGELIEMTPLLEAVTATFRTKEHNEIIELLINNGANVNAKYGNGRTPLDNAILFNRTETADILRKHGGKTADWFNADKSIHTAASGGNIEAVKQHIAAGTDVSAKAKYRRTPLHYAATKEIVELLIAKGGDVNAKDKDGGTPLHYAAGRGRKEVVELLIAKGGDVNAKRVDDKTPLDYAEEKIADLLRKHGGKTGEELKAEGK